MEKPPLNHIKKMVVESDNSKRKCIDGRYKENQSKGALSVAGADLGISLSLLALGIKPEESFKLVFNFLKKHKRPYCWHTDSHHQKDIGCGHLKTALLQPQDYGVKRKDVEKLISIVKKKQESSPQEMELTVLEGDHKEKGVLIVESSSYTVKPFDEKSDTQYFIYDKKRHQMFCEKLAEFWQKQKVRLDSKKIMEISLWQLDTTLKNLAKGKPIYSVKFKGKEPQISLLNSIQS